MQNTERWFVKYWRPAAAWIYLLICLFDFVLMPLYVSKTNHTMDEIVTVSMRLRPEDQLNALINLSRKNNWQPLTLAESGMFHVAFGAILGVAAWTRGRVQEARIRNGDLPLEEPEMLEPPQVNPASLNPPPRPPAPMGS